MRKKPVETDVDENKPTECILVENGTPSFFLNSRDITVIVCN
jgi:hypothetical protein